MRFNSDAHAIVALIDIVRDLNKSISQHVDNHNAKHVDSAIQRVGAKVSDQLADITEHFDDVEEGE